MLIPDEIEIDSLLQNLESKGSLSKEVQLIFVNLTEINDRTVNALSNYSGHQLSFPTLETLSTLHAEKLAKLNCQIIMNQLQTIEFPTIESLCKHKGELYLNGIEGIDLDQSKAWRNFQGTALFLLNAKIISEEVAVHLSHISGKVYFNPSLLSKEAFRVLQQKNKIYYPH